MEEGLHQGGAHHFQTPHQGRKENKNEQEIFEETNHISEEATQPVNESQEISEIGRAHV